MSPTFRRQSLAAFSIVIIILAGCAGQTVGAPAPNSTVASAAARQGAVNTSAMARTEHDRAVILATTTSTQDSGLLDLLVPMFEKQTGWTVKTVSVGTGAALALGARGEADVVLVHAPAAEVAWMAEGNGQERLLVMHNDFIIIGPPSDPDGIKGDASAVDAFKKIAQSKGLWVSRDDGSGTDIFEKQLWAQIGVSPKGQPWFLSSGQGMGPTLILADQKSAYTLSDRATYLAQSKALQSVVMVERDQPLLNIYHVMPVNPAKFSNATINVAGGKAFADFMVAADTQRVIADFGKDKYGETLFVPDAGKDEAQLSI